MSDYGLVWVDITPDFDPVSYADAFADDEQANVIRESESVEDSLRALYEWGYLSKRDGKIQLLVPEDALDEAFSYAPAVSGINAMHGPKERLRTKVPRRIRQYATAAKERLGASALGQAHARGKGYAAAPWSKGKGKVGKAGQYVKGVWGAGKTGKAAVIGAGATGLAAAGLGARALYKKMKAKKEKNEGLTDQDLDELLLFAEELGFDFETPEDIDETMEIGEYLDSVLDEAAENGLTEDFDEESIVEAALEEVSMGKRLRVYARRVKRAPGKAYAAAKEYGGRLKGAYAMGRAQGGSRIGSAARTAQAAYGALGKKAKIGLGAGAAVGAVGAGLAARALYKKMKKRKDQKESLDFDDLDLIIQDSIDLGFDFENYDELLDSLYMGEYLDNYLSEAEEHGLTEDVAEADIVLAAFDELDEAFSYAPAVSGSSEMHGPKERFLSRVRRAPGKALKAAGERATQAKSAVGRAFAKTQFGKAHTRGKGYIAYTPGELTRAQKAKEYVKGAWGGLNKTGKAAVIGTGIGAGVGTALAARAAYRKMKNRKKEESVEFNGYRSSAEGGVYESAPIPFGTGNVLYESRIVDSLWEQR